MKSFEIIYNKHCAEEKYFFLKNRLSKSWKELFWLTVDTSYTIDYMRPMLFDRFGDCIPEHLCTVIFIYFECLSKEEIFDHIKFDTFVDELEKENKN